MLEGKDKHLKSIHSQVCSDQSSKDRNLPTRQKNLPSPPRADLILSILIPVYNEEYYIEQVLEAVLGTSLPERVAREVVVVDDCSTDDTREILKAVCG